MNATAPETIELRKNGLVVKIRPTIKDETRHFIVDYYVNGKRKQVWRSTEAKAREHATEAFSLISQGDTARLEISNADQNMLVRASEALTGTGKPLDLACIEYAAVIKLLPVNISLSEAVNTFLKAYNPKLEKITVPAAVDLFLNQMEQDGKKAGRLEELTIQLRRFKNNFGCDVQDVTGKMLTDFLVGLGNADRSKKNTRNALVFFFNWCKSKYIPRTRPEELFETVPNYKTKKTGKIEIFTPAEMFVLMHVCLISQPTFVPYLAIRAFAGCRGTEVCRMDWKEIDLEDGFMEIRDVEGTKSEDRRRLVPISDNLKAWLKPFAKKSGPVCDFVKDDNQLAALALNTKNPAFRKNLPEHVYSLTVDWKRNALRHSCISYKVAQSADVARVSDESGNSVQVIKTNYLKRVKPAQAKEWFTIMPPKNVAEFIPLDYHQPTTTHA